MSGARICFEKPSRSTKAKGESSFGIAPNPWPRAKNLKFSLPDASLPVVSDDAWDQSDAYYYNNWVDIAVEPTQFMCANTLSGLGFYNDVSSILAIAQLTDLAAQTDVLYPNLVRKCLASAKVVYTNPKKPVASQGVLSFFAGGKKHFITIRDLWHLYGFDSTAENVDVPTHLSVSHAFWNFIAHGQYYSRSVAQSPVRNPALRIAAKLFSTLLFSRDDTSKVNVDELVLLYNAVRSSISAEPGLTCPLEVDVNMGAVLAGVIAEKRPKGGKGTTVGSEKIGSFFNSVVFALGCGCPQLDLEWGHLSHGHQLFFISYGILADATVYRFTVRDAHVLFCKLPQPSLTELDNAANVGFTPGTEYLYSESREPVFPEITPAGAATPGLDVPLSAEEIKDLEEQTANVQRSKANWRKSYQSEYLLREISDNPEEAEFRS